MEHFREPQWFAGHSLQDGKQGTGKLLRYDMENATTDNCCKMFRGGNCNYGSTSENYNGPNSFVTPTPFKTPHIVTHSETQTPEGLFMACISTQVK